MISASEALERLRQGNRRFVSDARRGDTPTSRGRRRELAAGQEPFAIILGCSDSRVPAEIVFDQGLGDLFVIRVAGNIVAPSQRGSVEFAAARFCTRLVVVLGLSSCGAILATLEELGRPAKDQSRNLRSIVGNACSLCSVSTMPPTALPEGRAAALRRRPCAPRRAVPAELLRRVPPMDTPSRCCLAKDCTRRPPRRYDLDQAPLRPSCPRRA